MHHPASPPRRAAPFLASALIVTLVACGGGGGPESPPPGGGNTDPGDAGAQALQAHLSICPNAQLISERVPCMSGVYEGKTTDTGAYCAFTYDGTTGVANYAAGSQAQRITLGAFSAAVFDKKADANPTGFAISWAIGIGSGKGTSIYYRSASEPASAAGLLVKPDNAGLPACLVTSGPAVAASGAANTANQTGRAWQAPQLLNGSSGALGVFADEPAFDAGLADDGRAFITFRQPDGSGRMAVYGVEGRAGGAGQSPSWSAPLLLDADAPLLAGNFRPRIAVSSTGHAVVSWLTERPCEADAYESSPAGKTCRYLYATRRLASDTAWEPARRVGASPPMRAQDHAARINARGDVVLVYPGFYFSFPGDTLSSTTAMAAIRHAGDAGYQLARLNGFWTNSADDIAFGLRIQTEVDDAGNLFFAGKSGGPFDVAKVRTTTVLAPSLTLADVTTDSGAEVFDLRSSGSGFAAYTWRNASGSRQNPEFLTLYSPITQQWFAAVDITAYTFWGDTTLVGTDHATGEFLLYAGCRVTAWRAGTWGSTRGLPAYCGRDRPGGVYAFNRAGDYIGLNWAGQSGQWGYYSRAQDATLKGAPGSGRTVAGDFVLGTPSSLFGAAPTQLLLASNGVALAVTSNNYTVLPSASNPAGTAGSPAVKLWGVFLK